VDDDDSNEHDKHLRDALAQLKKQADESIAQMSNSLMEAMGPMLGGMALLQDEAKAWDQHACAFVSALNLAHGEALPENTEKLAVTYADSMLAARRERFNEEQLKERMRGILPSGRGLCNKAILHNDGNDSGHRCARNDGHEGICF
jgi:hypothetical protein